MKIMQMLPTLSYGDGIGNDVLAIDKVLKEIKVNTKVYAESIDKRVPRGIAEPVSQLLHIDDSDIIIYHLSTGSDLNEKIREFKAKIIIIYHNITPPHFFNRYNYNLQKLCETGIKQVENMKDMAKYCLAVSEFNKQDLIKYGYNCPIDILPILIPFKSYNSEPKRYIISKYDDDYINIIFTGRIAPNKKHEDVIKIFYYYKKYINQKSRLILVGSYDGMEKYFNRLSMYINELEINDVIFTGHVKFDEVLAYYKIADVFVCMSEHEGFCIPLVEAMYFQVPIIAHSCTGVKDTLGDSGILLKNKDFKLAAELINKVVTSEELRNYILNKQKKRLKYFSYENIKAMFINYLMKFLNM